MIMLLVWMVLVYIIFVRKRTLTCPHCGQNGISASKKFFNGPIVKFRCSLCGKRCATSYWSLVVILIAFSYAFFASLMSQASMSSDYVPISGYLMSLIAISLDAIIRLYILPTKKK